MTTHDFSCRPGLSEIFGQRALISCYYFLLISFFLRRNCKANPNCFNCLGEKFWLGEIKGKKKNHA